MKLPKILDKDMKSNPKTEPQRIIDGSDSTGS